MKKLWYKIVAVLLLTAITHLIITFISLTPNPLEWTHFERFCYGVIVGALFYSSFVRGTKADNIVKF